MLQMTTHTMSRSTGEGDLAKWGSRMRRLRHDSIGRLFGRWLLVAAALLLSIVVAEAARADSVRLHDQAGAQAGKVTLAQIAELEGDAAQELASLVITTMPADQKSVLTVTLDDVRRAMSVAGVNWGRVTLKGFTRCGVSRLPNEATPITDAGQAAALNPVSPIDTAAPGSLGAMVAQRLAEITGLPREELVVSFSDRDAENLRRNVLAHRYEIEPLSTLPLGRVPVRVWRYEGGAPAEQFTLNATVQRRAMALTVKRSIRRGEPFDRDAVELKEVLIDEAGVEPMTDRELVVGQLAAAPLQSGEVLFTHHLRSQVLVRRGELVTVRALAGSLVVRSKAKAMEDGSEGDLIVLRSESSHDTFTAQVVGRGLAVVRSAPPPQPQLAQREGSSL